MVTTDRLISLDTVGRDGKDLIHLTGFLHVVARAAVGEPDGAPIQVDLRFDAARLRGVGLRMGTRYGANGVHQSRHQPGEFAAPFDVVSCFELLGYVPDDPHPLRLTLAIRFTVTVPPDGRVRIAAEDVQLLPVTDGGARGR